jgi:Flp pilus assembly protein TadD
MRRLCLYLVLIITSCGVCAASSSTCTPPPDLQSRLQNQAKAETYAEAGMWYASRGKFDCAVNAYRAAVNREPRSAEFSYLLGLNLLRKRDFQGAIQPLQQSIQLNSDVIKPHILLATALEELHRTAEARTEWLAALKIDQHSEIALEGASKNFLGAGDSDSVISLLAPEPKSEDLTLALATAYKAVGKTDQAIEVLKKGLEAHPKSQALTRELITNLFVQRRFEESAKLAKHLVQESPNDLSAKTLYLHVLVLNDDEALARPLAKKLLLAAPHDFTVLYLNGLLENRSGNYAAARSFLEKAVAVHPDQSDCRYNLGIAMAHVNDPRGAREQFEKALALGASDPSIRSEYAKVLRTLGETTLASEQLELYQKEEKAKAGRTQAAITMAHGDTELANDNPKRAAELYREAIAAMPDYALLYYKLSVALDRLGDTAGERENLLKAVQIDSGMAIAHRQLGYLAFNDGDFVSAEDHLRKAVAAAPTYADAWVSLAATLGTESRIPEAQEAVQKALEIDPQNANAIDLQKQLNAGSQAHP